MTTYTMTTTHTADALQYTAPTATEPGNVDELKELCDELTEQADWSPATGQTALVLDGASLANTDWLLKFDDDSVLILSPDEFEASGYKAVDAPAAPPVTPPAGGPVSTAKSPTDDTPPAK